MMSILKRRLSRGSNTSLLPFEDDIDEIDIDPMAEINSIGISKAKTGAKISSMPASLFIVDYNVIIRSSKSSIWCSKNLFVWNTEKLKSLQNVCKSS